ncbi:hypothetical protein E2562_036481 [Oryza meyeriana var. granulata]|uniref:Uncharacterized protein n=1 Tax=Oryza meyeriana var. granulata TaxID=110450 RepID=A0A6G1DSS9_9ORYZ|nr:hypothetical protein E2562_036481 [Oryza meyeriana var. granulata]
MSAAIWIRDRRASIWDYCCRLLLLEVPRPPPPSGTVTAASCWDCYRRLLQSGNSYDLST